MSSSMDKKNSNRIPRIAFFLSLTAFVIPICYTMYMIATLPYHRGPFYTEVRMIILILGLVGAGLGILALVKRTRLKVLTIIAVILGLIVPIQHVIFCGSDPLHQKLIILCPMLWGIKIP